MVGFYLSLPIDLLSTLLLGGLVAVEQLHAFFVLLLGLLEFIFFAVRLGLGLEFELELPLFQVNLSPGFVLLLSLLPPFPDVVDC